MKLIFPQTNTMICMQVIYFGFCNVLYFLAERFASPAGHRFTVNLERGK